QRPRQARTLSHAWGSPLDRLPHAADLFLALATCKPSDRARWQVGKSAPSIREWPDPQFLLADLPKAGKAVWLYDQEQDDEGAQDHEGEVLDGRGTDVEAKERGRKAQQNRQPPDQRGAE